MKKFFFPLFALAFSAFHAISADLIVEEFGTLPTYPSINAAYNAAQDGDRIIIKNRAGDIPWIENLTIAKSLTFLSYTNNVQFIVQGEYTITAADNRLVIFIGMKNTAGSIQSGTGTSAARGTKVSIMDSWLVNGNLLFNSNLFDVQLVGNRLENGRIDIDWGNIIGNEVSTTATTAITISSSVTTNPTDTCYIVGNQILNAGTTGMFVDGRIQVYHIKNNFIKAYNSLQVSKGNTLGIPNYVYNNTLIATSCGVAFNGCIYVNGTLVGSVWEVMNNVCDRSSGTNCTNNYAINGAGVSGQANVYYNHVDANFTIPIWPNFTFAGNNTTGVAIDVNQNTGVINSGSPINGGNPAAPFYDLDLSVGDAGCWGGSYTLANFYPLFAGAARVYFVSYPFNVRQGNTLATKAFGFDR